MSPAFPVINLIKPNMAMTKTIIIAHMAFALEVRPSISRKMISMAANLTLAKMRKMTAEYWISKLLKNHYIEIFFLSISFEDHD